MRNARLFVWTHPGESSQANNSLKRTNSVRKRKYDLYNDYIRIARENRIPVTHIAKYLKVSEKVIRKRCKEYGLQGDGVLDNLNDEEDIKARVEEKAPGFEYVSGYVGIDKKAYIKCRKCQTITYRSMQFLKQHRWLPTCKTCQKIETAERIQRKKEEARAEKEKKRIEDKAQREQEKLSKMMNRKATQASMRACPRCNGLFVPRKQGQQYCSTRCGELAHYALKKDHRLKKMREVVIDKGITLQALYQRDNGKCWICGKPCDYTADINANDYPSIDHVRPLAKGGKHSWDNVRLAHRICNSKKKDRIIEAGT